MNHIDENPKNNSADNLEWCTVQYNNTYGSAPEKRRQAMRKHFKDHPEARDRVRRQLKLRVLSAKSREKIAKTLSKPVVCLQKGQVIARYESAKSAEEKTGIKRGNICKVLHGERKSAGGFQWAYDNTTSELESITKEEAEDDE